MLNLKDLGVELNIPENDYYTQELERQRKQVNRLIEDGMSSPSSIISWSYDVFPAIHNELERAGWRKTKSNAINTYTPVWVVDASVSADEYVNDGPIKSAKTFYNKTLAVQKEIVNSKIRAHFDMADSNDFEFAQPTLKFDFEPYVKLAIQFTKVGWQMKKLEAGFEIFPIWLVFTNIEPEKCEVDNGILPAFDFYKLTVKRQAEQIVDKVTYHKPVELPYTVYPVLVDAMKEKGWEYVPIGKHSLFALPYSYFYPKWAKG